MAALTDLQKALTFGDPEYLGRVRGLCRHRPDALAIQ